MSNYSSLKATINANIKTNGNQEITGSVMNSVLNAMVNSLGAGYQYIGIAAPNINPGTPDNNVFYIAATAGTYTNFGGLSLSDGEVAILKYNGTWAKQSISIPTTYVTDEISKRIGLNSGVYDEYVGSPTTLQTRICSSILDIKLFGFDPTALYAPYVIWANYVNNFHFRIAKYNGSSWDVVFQYSIAASTLNPNGNNLVSIDATNNGLRVVATLDLSKASSGGSLVFQLTGNPPLVFSKTCFVKTYDNEISQLGSDISALNTALQNSDTYLMGLTKRENNAISSGYYVSSDEFSLSGYIIKTNGTLQSHSTYKATDYIPVRPGSSLILKASCDTNACIGFYNAQKAYVNDYAQHSGGGEWTLNIPEGVYFIRLCNNTSNFTDAYAKPDGATIGSVASQVDIHKKYGNNVWVTYGDMDHLSWNYNGFPRRAIYSAFRKVKFIGCDPTIPRTLFVVWNIYGTGTQIRISYYNSQTSAWVQEFSYSYSTSESLTDIREITMTSGTKSVKMLVDFSILPNVPTGALFNALNATPELIFSSDCYSDADVDQLADEVESLQESVASMENLGANKIVRMFPNTKLPVISFEFDDVVDNDAQVVSLFDSYGAKANFAFIASDAKLSTYGKKYLQWQKNGHGILSHSINSTIFNTDNYTPATALAAFQESKNKLEKAGFVINGWVSPSSQMAAEFIDGIKATYAYAFTYGSANNRQSNPCTITRYSIQSHTIAEIEAFVDSCISGDNILTFYGHAADFGNTYNGEVWNIAKLTTILQYVLAKRDLGLVYFDNTDNCIKYYFDL